MKTTVIATMAVITLMMCAADSENTTAFFLSKVAAIAMGYATYLCYRAFERKQQKEEQL